MADRSAAPSTNQRMRRSHVEPSPDVVSDTFIMPAPRRKGDGRSHHPRFCHGHRRPGRILSVTIFRGDVILHAAFPHPPPKRLVALNAAQIVSCVLTTVPMLSPGILSLVSI